MLIPIRCFTCGKSVANLWESYLSQRSEDVPYEDIMRSLGVSRYCCKRMLLTHQDVGAEIVKYEFKDRADCTSKIRCKSTRTHVVSCD